jgi:hypothetical protein
VPKIQKGPEVSERDQYPTEQFAEAPIPCHIGRMAKGWKIVTVLPNPGGAAPLQEWSLVAIPDKGEAIRAIKARHPHAAIRVDSEANAELLAKYDVRDGKIFVLVEGS